jgi:hypothetical protein
VNALSPDAAWQSLLRDSGDRRFSAEMVSGLPEPARRYLLHAITPGTILSTCVELDMEGRFRAKPGGKWLPMRGVELLSHPGGFVWHAEIGNLLRFSGHDLYAGGEGQMQWKLWGVMPLVQASGDDISRSARGRAVAEAAAWLPVILLPEFGARWEAISDDLAKVTLEVDEEQFDITFRFDETGAVKQMQLDRWGNHLTPNSEWASIPTSARCEGESTYSGFTIPSHVTAAWWTATKREFDFFEARITNARYH